MELTSHYNDLNEFLAKHSLKKDGDTSLITHTRIGDKTLNIYGGSYVIPKEELSVFYKLYGAKVFEKKQMEYLTEKQQKEKGPILIDLDFRYAHTTTSRQHTKEHIQDLLCLGYLEKLKELLSFEENRTFPIYVMEKPDVNRLADGSLTKDGIHIIIGIQMDHTLQQILREKVLEEIPKIMELPLINDWPAVLDEGISKGTTNWQLFGSRKPGNQAYELTQYYKISYDSSDGEFIMDECRIDDIEISKDLCKLSAQYDGNPAFEMNPAIKELYNSRVNNKPLKPKSQTKTKLRLLTPESEEENQIYSLQDIVDQDSLKRAVENMMKSFKLDEYELKEIHEYTQILPQQYYEPGSHDKNIRVAFALKNTDERLFLSWVLLRSKASDFDYASIPVLYEKWNKHLKERQEGITRKSIIYWAKQDAPEEYERVKKTTINYFIEKTLVSPTEWDFAMVLYQMFKEIYVCSSYVNKTWYVFKNHRWELDEGQTLRLLISVDMYNIYQEKMTSIMNEMNHYEPSDERYAAKSKMVKWVSELSTRMRTTSIKNNIFREAHELFFDKEFTKNMDTNRYLMCFTNGVIDIKNKIFRDGYPQDYITKCTNIPYYELDLIRDAQMMQSITSFMQQLFPVEELNKYMWDHLSSVLIGENINQVFNIYRGSGSNGKSMLSDLMTFTLGEYAGSVPITLVTEKRVGQGQTSSEIMQLKGVRYAVMQEPTKDSCKLNEGVMKNLTGDSTLQARELYCKSETFQIQFHLVVCTNTLFEINSNDDGTWRRICIVDFMSKFVDPEAPAIDDTPYQFPKDKNLKEKLPKMARVFASMLVKRAFETQGKVEICDIVRASSNKYRQGQDHIAAFVAEMTCKKEGKKIAKRELMEQFKIWFQDQQGGRRPPKGVELQEFMDKKFGKARRDGWHNVEIIYPENEIIEELA
jgi:P4 family phage/plasmid primase-like protien